MQLDFAFLANFANHLQDGRLVIFGADIDGMECVGFPALDSRLVLVAKFWVFPDEPTEGHRLSIDLTKADSQRVPLITDEPLEAIRNHRNPDRPSAAQVTVNLMMNFQAAGTYLFHLSIDGEEVKAVPFHVTLTPTESVQPTSLKAESEDAEWVELEKELLSNAELLEIHEYLKSVGQ